MHSLGGDAKTNCNKAATVGQHATHTLSVSDAANKSANISAIIQFQPILLGTQVPSC